MGELKFRKYEKEGVTEYMIPYMVEISPEEAKEFLDRTHREFLGSSKFINRNVRNETVKAYARDMERGKWADGNVIAFDKGGNVIDGQHRLKAVIESNIPQAFYVRMDVDAENALFDMGVPRSVSDIIKITNPNMLSIYKEGKTVTFLKGLIAKDKYRKVTLADILSYIEEYDETLRPFIERILSQKTTKAKIGAMPTMTALYLAYINGISLDDIDHFYKIFKSGFGTCERDIPIIATRNWFFDNIIGGGAEVRNQMIDRVQYGLRQYLQEKTSNRYYPPKERIWTYPDDPLQEGKDADGNQMEMVDIPKVA